MTAFAQYQFALEIDTNMDAPTLVVSDKTDQDAVRTYTQPLPKSGLPYTLLLWHPPESPDNLTIVPAEPLIRQLLTNWDETLKAAIRAGLSNNATAPAVPVDGVSSPSTAPVSGAPKNGVTLPVASGPAVPVAETPISGAPKDAAPASAESTNAAPISAESTNAAPISAESKNAAPISAVPKNATPSSASRSTSGPKYWLELTLDTNPAPPTLTVKDTTNPDLISTTTVLLPNSRPPYVLEVAPAAQSPNSLSIAPGVASGAFDANVTSGRSVLQLSGSISDHRLITHDDTRYTINLKNVSEYYVADEIEVRLVLAPIPTLADGTDPLVIIPTEQRVRCIEPGDEHDVVFSVITRGIRPGHYPLRVHLTYRIVYWDGRRTSTTYSQMLRVQE